MKRFIFVLLSSFLMNYSFVHAAEMEEGGPPSKKQVCAAPQDYEKLLKVTVLRSNPAHEEPPRPNNLGDFMINMSPLLLDSRPTTFLDFLKQEIAVLKDVPMEKLVLLDGMVAIQDYRIDGDRIERFIRLESLKVFIRP